MPRILHRNDLHEIFAASAFFSRGHCRRQCRASVVFRKDNMMRYIEEYYNSYDEDARLLSRHGQVEYLTTMKYIAEYLSGIACPSIIEIGAGTGRYSVALAKQGYKVTAIDLVQKNIDVMKSKLDGTEDIRIIQGNALDLSCIKNNSFDLTMLLGPMYHLYTKEDKLRVLSEAVRITRPGGYILVAYCMNESTVIQYIFGMANPPKASGKKTFDKVTKDWRCMSQEEELFEMIRTEEIAELDSYLPVERIKLIATDGATNYNRQVIDSMDDEMFEKWMSFHFATCERQDLVGASNHTLDILRKL